MVLPNKLKGVLERIPPDRRGELIAKIRERLAEFEPDDTFDYAIIGGLLGGLIDIIPGTGILSEDWCVIGIVCGSLVGRIREKRRRGDREDLLAAVQEALNVEAA